jgi:putative membrane protein
VVVDGGSRRETAHAALGERSNRISRVVAGAATLTAWDLFLDPQMVGEGYWRWDRLGAYRGIPLSNYIGWFATGIGVMTLLEVLLPPGEPSPDLVAHYGAMATMETAAFATFLDDRVVAVTGAIGMSPVAAVAVVRLVGQRT